MFLAAFELHYLTCADALNRNWVDESAYRWSWEWTCSGRSCSCRSPAAAAGPCRGGWGWSRAGVDWCRAGWPVSRASEARWVECRAGTWIHEESWWPHSASPTCWCTDPVPPPHRHHTQQTVQLSTSNINEPTVHSRLHPQPNLLVCITQKNLVVTDTAISAVYMRLLLRNTHDAPLFLCGNMTSSAKPEVHNEKDPGTTTVNMFIQNLRKSDFCSWDMQAGRHRRHTNRQTDINRDTMIAIFRTTVGSEGTTLERLHQDNRWYQTSPRATAPWLVVVIIRQFALHMHGNYLQT